MSDGLNKRFMDDPRSFLSKHPLSISEGNSLASPSVNWKRVIVPEAEVPYQFDIKAGAGGVYLLNLFENRTERKTSKTKIISAYWLPWDPTTTRKLRLGAQADFFFTAQLTGCRIQVGAGDNPEVRHIPGENLKIERVWYDSNEQYEGEQKKWRDEESNSGPLQRRFSFTQHYSDTVANGGWAFVVGKAVIAAQGSRKWEFYAQGVIQQNGKTSIGGLTQHHNGTLSF